MTELNAINTLLNLLYPPRCIFCGEMLEPQVCRLVCVDCANTLPYCRMYKRCTRCGKPINSEKDSVCRECRLKRNYTKRVTSAFIYEGNAKLAIIDFKKEYNSFYAKTLSLYVAEMIKYDFGGVLFDIVVSAPPRRKGPGEENFDHAGCLAQYTARRLGIPYKKKALYQISKIKKQSELSVEARYENVKGNFALSNPDSVKGKTVLVIDDVHTTGATIEECAKVLTEAGAYAVYGATAATTLKYD